MKRWKIVSLRAPALIAACSLGIVAACGDDGSPEDEQTGTVLQGTVTSFEPQVVTGGFGLFSTEGVTVSIGSLSTETDANGNFTLRNFGLGNQNLLFSLDSSTGTFVLSYVERGESIYLNEVQFSGGNISTEHTGTWVGTGGPAGVALTMVIAHNGNALSGTASIAGADSTIWTIDGKETGAAAKGTMDVVTTASECASGVEFDGTFSGDTLKGTYLEVYTADYPTGDECDTPETGDFTVVKQ